MGQKATINKKNGNALSQKEKKRCRVNENRQKLARGYRSFIISGKKPPDGKIIAQNYTFVESLARIVYDEFIVATKVRQAYDKIN